MNIYNAKMIPNRLNLLTKLIFSFSVLMGVTPVDAVYENHFFDDASLTGNIFFWNRDRDRKDIETNKYKSNIRQSTFNSNLDYRSGYIADRFAIELGGYGAWEVSNGGNGHPNEIGFSGAHTRWDEDWKKDVSGLSFYKAQANFKIDELFWVKAGYIQPSGQTLLAQHWSLLPGTYRGFEVGSTLDFDSAGALSMSYMWSDKYKALGINGFMNLNSGEKVKKLIIYILPV